MTEELTPWEIRAKAYIDVSLELAAQVGADKSQEMTKVLFDAARAGYIRYNPGKPLMIDGVDCSPEHVRSLQRTIACINGTAEEES